jgi:fusion and transport protein UGO1
VGCVEGVKYYFVYSVLLKTIESWSGSLLSALLNVPDPGIIAGLGASVDVVDRHTPGLLLESRLPLQLLLVLYFAPLDIIRTK